MEETKATFSFAPASTQCYNNLVPETSLPYVGENSNTTGGPFPSGVMTSLDLLTSDLSIWWSLHKIIWA